MQLRVLDEVIEMGGLGVALLWMEGGDVRPYEGMRLRDARGNVHTVVSVSEQEDVTVLHIPEGSADYFGRLMRDVRVDATLFEEVSPCPSASSASEG